MGDIAFVVLDLFLVTAELLLDLVNANIHRRFRCRPRFLGNKIVLVLGRDQNLDLPAVLAVIDRDFDRHQATEVFEQLLGLIVQVTLLLGVQPTVTGRYLDLHPTCSLVGRPVILVSRTKATIKINPIPTVPVKTPPDSKPARVSCTVQPRVPAKIMGRTLPRRPDRPLSWSSTTDRPGQSHGLVRSSAYFGDHGRPWDCVDSTLRSARELAGFDAGRGPAGPGSPGLAGLGPGQRVEGRPGRAGDRLRCGVARLRHAGADDRWPAWRSAWSSPLLRIVWLIVAAVFLYDITVATGQFEVMKASVARLSADRRLQAVLVAFCFGAFIEGAAGFGAPVAISAAFLVGLGFRAVPGGLALLDRQHGTGGLGRHRHPDPDSEQGHRAGRPGPERHLRADLADPLAGDSVLAGSHDDRLAGDRGRLVSARGHRRNVRLRSIPLVELRRLRAGRHRRVGREHGGRSDRDPPLAVLGETWRFERDAERDWRFSPAAPAGPIEPGRSDRRASRAGLDAVCALDRDRAGLGHSGDQAVGHSRGQGLARRSSSPGSPSCPGSICKVAKGPAVTGHETPAAPGFREGPDRDRPAVVHRHRRLSGGRRQRLPARRLAHDEDGRLLAGTVRRMIPAIAAILCMLALGFVTKYSGMDAVLGLAFTRTGPLLYPIFGTLLGWLGVALTGSDTSSNVLFGNLQKITAQKLGLDPILMASANSTGGVMGKMIDAQSIVVAAAATGEGGREGELLRAVFWHSIVLALLVGAIVWVYAHVFPAWSSASRANERGRMIASVMGQDRRLHSRECEMNRGRDTGRC